jgi:rhodanese-related sulfurtransferase
MDIQDILKQEETTIIDVRESYEFMSDRVFDAINMPLSKFGEYIDQIKNMKGNKVFYCRSGNRSGQAVNYLKSIGVQNVYNGGSLMLMQSYVLA